jgi:ribonuclease R
MTAAFLSERCGEIFPGQISGITTAGLFIRLTESGADGLVPLRSLGDDYFDVDPMGLFVKGRRWGKLYHLGQKLTFRLLEADKLTGSLLLELAEKPDQRLLTGPAESGGHPAWATLRALDAKTSSQREKGRTQKTRRKRR